jgi:two-component system cell cycle response regulator
LPRLDRSASRIPILLAEDSVVIQTVVRNMLVLWGYDVVSTTDGIAAWNILQTDSAPRLAIFDWMMPGLQGPEICRRLRAEHPSPYTYVILLTSRDDSADIVEGLDAGADDYLTKPFDARELRARVRAGERVIRLQEDLVAAREELRERATLDHLTRLLNRATILEQLESSLAVADRDGRPFSILLIDIDRFRLINDSFGHATGDAVLCEFGRRLAAAAPVGAQVGRFGGEEFLVVLPGVEMPAARQLAATIQETVTAEPFRVGAASFPVSCAVGVADRAMPFSADRASLLRSGSESLDEVKTEARRRIAGALRAAAASVAAPVSPASFVTNPRRFSI